MSKKNLKRLEHKTLSLKVETVKEVKSEDGTKERIIEGYASTFGDVDSYGDVVQPGAFVKTLDEKNRGRKVKFLYQHNSYEPIGVPLEIREDAKGLYFKAQFADTMRADDAYKLAKMGALDGFSIGYRTIKSADNDHGGRDLLEVDLGEVSLVTFEANVGAKVSSVKSAKGDAYLIAGLMELGHSREQAIEAVKSLSLDNDEPAVEDDHSEKRADDTPTSEAVGDSMESRKAAEDILHSLRTLKEKIETKGA